MRDGRGVIYSFIHLGAYQGVFAPIHRLGIKTHFPVGPWLIDPPEDNEWGLRVEHWRRRLEVLDIGMIPLKGSYEVLRALLEQRKLVMIAFDMPGSLEIEYLGKPVMVASGTANLAFQTDSVVIPAHRIRHGLGYTIEIGPALDPREAENPLELTQAARGGARAPGPERPRRTRGPRQAGRLGGRRQRHRLAPPVALDQPARRRVLTFWTIVRARNRAIDRTLGMCGSHHPTGASAQPWIEACGGGC